MRSPDVRNRWLPRAVAGVLSGMGVVYLVSQGAAAEQKRLSLQPNLPGIWTPVGADPNRGEVVSTEKPAPGFTKQVKEYLDANYTPIMAEGKKWEILITEPVRIRINHPDGVLVRDLPDQGKGKILGALSDGSAQGVSDKFILGWNQDTNEVSVWVARKGLNNPEFFAMRHQGIDLVALTSELSEMSGQPLSVKDLVGRFLPEDYPFFSGQQSK